MFLANQQEQPRIKFQLAITLKSSQQLIGNCGIRLKSAEAHEGDIGYELSPKHWWRGYATEAARAIVAFGFEQLRLHRICPGASRRMLVRHTSSEAGHATRRATARERILQRSLVGYAAVWHSGQRMEVSPRGNEYRHRQSIRRTIPGTHPGEGGGGGKGEKGGGREGGEGRGGRGGRGGGGERGGGGRGRGKQPGLASDGSQGHFPQP